MRTTARVVWLWLACLVYGLPFPRAVEWQGATADWSPTASVMAVGDSAGWDVAGWMDKGQRRLHRQLDAVEHRLWSDLESLLAEVYVWRDAV